MKQIHRNRLLKLADLLDENAKNTTGAKFDMCSWGFSISPDAIPMSCGTTGCAMGLAAISGVFKRAGLTHEFIPDDRPEITSAALDFVWKGEKIDAYEAAAKLFGMSYDDTEELFANCLWLKEAKGERLQAKRIRHFAKTGKHIYFDEDGNKYKNADEAIDSQLL